MNDAPASPPPVRAAITRAAALSELRRVLPGQSDEVLLAEVPLRVCPLGAHIDHQGGTVTGFAIDRPLRLLFSPRSDGQVHLRSLNFSGDVNFSLENIPPKHDADWGNYPRGAAQALQRFVQVRTPGAAATRGLNGAVLSELPVGGLSSSAAFSCACLLAYEQVNGVSCNAQENIELARSTENDYLGLRNGILDQSVILSARRNELTTIDCAAREIRNVPAAAEARDYGILVVYSGLSRKLVNTAYNQRVGECLEAAKFLAERMGKDFGRAPRLGDIPAEVYERERHSMPAVLARRAAHFFSESRRVRGGIECWRSGDLRRFGTLISESGRSSIVNYEAGSPALITLYEILAETPGVYGARFCGGGFQGCCFALIQASRGQEIAAEVEKRYLDTEPEAAHASALYFCASTDGPRVLSGKELSA